MRLNALSPSDNPMEELLFCFGGPDDGGNGGGSTQDAQMDELDQISADFENMSQQQAAGESVTSGMSGGVGRGGSANDNDGDGIPNSIDATPGVDRSGIGAGGGDAFDQSRDYLDQSIADFSRGPAGAAGSNIDDSIAGYDIDTLVAGTSRLGPNTMADISFTDQQALDAARAGLADTPFSPGAVSGEPQRDTRTAVERDILGGDEYTTQDIFDVDPTGLGFETPQERINRQKAEDTRAAAQAAAVERARVASEQAQKEALQRTLGIPERDIAMQSRLDAMNDLVDQARTESEADVQAMIDQDIAARESRTSDRGVGSLMGDTIFERTEEIGPFEDIGIGQSAAVPGINTNISGVTEVDATQEAADAALAATTGGIQNITDAQGNVIGVERSVNLGGGITQAELDQARAEGRAKQGSVMDTPDSTQAERAAAADAAARERTVNGVPVTDLSQPRTERPSTFNPTVEVVNVSGPGRKEIDIADYQPTDYDNEDLARAEREFDRINLEVAERDFDAARREAYADKQFGFDTGLPGSIDIFGAKVPTGVGVVEGIVDALFDPTSSAANAIAERGIKSVDGMSAEGTANYNPNGLEVVTAGGPLSEGGRTAAYDPSNNIVYDTSPFSGLNPFGEGVPDNIQDLYNRKNAIDDAERARQGGDGGEPIIPPLIEEEPVVPEEVPPGFELGEYQYEPMDPVQISYTGIPTLAPRILRPSRMASRNIQPLYDFSGLGSLRRS